MAARSMRARYPRNRNTNGFEQRLVRKALKMRELLKCSFIRVEDVRGLRPSHFAPSFLAA